MIKCNLFSFFINQDWINNENTIWLFALINYFTTTTVQSFIGKKCQNLAIIDKKLYFFYLIYHTYSVNIFPTKKKKLKIKKVEVFEVFLNFQLCVMKTE